MERRPLYARIAAELRASIADGRHPPGALLPSEGELAGIEYEHLHDRLKHDGYAVYAGQGALAAEIFRVCCMGAVEPEALVGFAVRLRVALHATRVPA